MSLNLSPQTHDGSNTSLSIFLSAFGRHFTLSKKQMQLIILKFKFHRSSKFAKFSFLVDWFSYRRKVLLSFLNLRHIFAASVSSEELPSPPGS